MKKKDQGISTSGLEQPSVNFTSNLMKGIEAEEMALAKIVSEHGILSPSPAFSTEIASKIISKKSFVYTPVISKMAWYFIAAILITVFAIVLANSGNSASAPVMSYLSSFTKFVASIFSQSSILHILPVVLLAISVMLLIDQRIAMKRGIFLN